MPSFTVVKGDVRTLLADMDDKSVRCCVTSPPYWGLRDYGTVGQLGLEPTPDAYVQNMVEVFREVRRVLTDDGTLWLNLGDSYARAQESNVPQTKNAPVSYPKHSKVGSSNGAVGRAGRPGSRGSSTGLKTKDLVGIPWRVAFALQADGWYLRSDIIWHKPNPMPESVTDRPTKSHEYLFLLTKSAKYYYDHEAMKEQALHPAIKHKSSRKTTAQESAHFGNAPTNLGRCGTADNGMRNRRTVWSINTRPFKGAHFAVMPEALVEPCILAGSAEGDMVLDPFTGSGTVGVVALRHGRDFMGFDLNKDYVEMAKARIRASQKGA